MVASIADNRNFRPEIQGVRTLGALLVAIFHIWMGSVSGGVDVFFVISGYLMTSALVGRYIEGRYSIIRFWGGIIRRVAPVAYLVMFVTLIGAMFIIPQTRWLDTLSQFKYAFVHLENWKLMFDAVDYLERENLPSPLQHYWALSVQIQFYLIWPFVILAAGYVLSKLKQGKGVFAAFIGVLSTLSLCYSIYTTEQDQPAAYFNTFARLWEFGIGGLIAIYLKDIQPLIPAMAKTIIGWLGVIGIISCGFVLDTTTTFPGFYALWPVLSAALVVIAGGGGSNTSLGVERLLASKPFVFLGGTSFAFYLWHWPILIFVMEITGTAKLGIFTGLAVLYVSLVLAYLTMRFIELPLKRAQFAKKSWWGNIAFGAVCALPVALCLLSWNVYAKREYNLQKLALENLNTDYYPGGRLLASAENQVKSDLPVVPGAMYIDEDIPEVYNNGCHLDLYETEPKDCIYGPTENYQKTIILVGGSHIAQWTPTFKIIAERNEWKVYAYTKSSCSFMVEGLKKDETCRIWNENVMAKIQEIRPDLVFTTATRPGKLSSWKNSEGEYIPEEYLAKWRELSEQEVEIVALRDNPWMLFDVVGCLAKHENTPLHCTKRKDELLNDERYKKDKAKAPPNVSFIDLTPHFCDETKCYAMLGNIAIYRDAHHITVPFVKSLNEVLERQLRQVITKK